MFLCLRCSFSTEGIALWIVPPDNDIVTVELETLITTLSEKQSSPKFHPHVTLASLPQCISLEEITTCLLDAIPVEPIMINFRGVQTGQTYFQSVFIAIEATQTILDLHKHVHGTLGVQPKTPQFPHLSLYYGDKDKQETARIAEKLLLATTSGFRTTDIWIVNCEGRPESWSILEKFQLSLK